MEKKVNKDYEPVFGFDEKYMIGFSDILHPEELGNNVHGFSKLNSYFEYVINKGYFKLRGEAEKDPSFKQVIPYVTIKCNDLFLSYERCGNESRLNNQISIGIGGHINNCDLPFPIRNMTDTVENAAVREFNEELKIKDKESDDDSCIRSGLLNPAGFIYAGNKLEVDSVHFGVVYEVDVSRSLSERIELTDEGINLSWKTREELLKEESLEKWSRMFLESVE